MLKMSTRINHLLSVKHMSQKKLSDITGIMTSTLSGIIKYDKEPLSGNLFLIAKALDVSMEWLFTGDLTDNEEKRRKEKRIDYIQPCMSNIIEISVNLHQSERKKILKMLESFYESE